MAVVKRLLLGAGLDEEFVSQGSVLCAVTIAVCSNLACLPVSIKSSLKTWGKKLMEINIFILHLSFINYIILLSLNYSWVSYTSVYVGSDVEIVKYQVSFSIFPSSAGSDWPVSYYFLLTGPLTHPSPRTHTLTHTCKDNLWLQYVCWTTPEPRWTGVNSVSELSLTLRTLSPPPLTHIHSHS